MKIHRAIRLQAAQHGRSTEAEIREILAQSVRPEGRLRIGAELRIESEPGEGTRVEVDFDVGRRSGRQTQSLEADRCAYS